MDRKIHLAGPRQTVYPTQASVHLYMTSWGIETTTGVRFESLPHAGPWSFRFPVNPDISILDVIVTHADKFGQTVIRGRQRACELIVNDIELGSRTTELNVIVVAAQPVSFRRLYMEWLHLGTPATPCSVSLRVDLGDLPLSMFNDAEVVLSSAKFEGSKPLIESHSDGVHRLSRPAILNSQRNPRLAVRLCVQSQGFRVVEPIYGETSDGRFVMLHPNQTAHALPWYVKSKSDAHEPDNIIWASVSRSPPHNATLATNSDLLLTVASSILEKGATTKKIVPALWPTNATALVCYVRANPSCSNVHDKLRCSDPDVQHLLRVAHVANRVTLKNDPLLEFLPKPTKMPFDDLPGVVMSVLSTLGL